MSKNTEFKIAVASDLHAYVETPGKTVRRPSHLCVSGDPTQPGSYPITGLLERIKDSGITADLLLCPGDLGDKARPESIQHAWKELHRVKDALGARGLFATAGNHDVDSRYEYSNPDPQQVLKNLDPPYPVSDEALNDKYWAREFAVTDNPEYRLVILNTSAHHGKMPHEENHGRITATALEALSKKLESTEPKLINLLLCHHHPQPHSELKLGFADMMQDGQLLLDLLGSGRLGRWLVIHGHKHHPKITYAAGGCGSPVVLAAASLCAELYLELQTATRNQFHVITLDTTLIRAHGLVGRVDSWVWAAGIGWEPAPPASGLPKQCGFGFRGDLRLLCSRVDAELPSAPAKVEWATLCLKLPELNYVLPQDYLVLKETLGRVGIGIEEMDGLPYEVGRNK